MDEKISVKDIVTGKDLLETRVAQFRSESDESEAT